jgi:hypothetical protein
MAVEPRGDPGGDNAGSTRQARHTGLLSAEVFDQHDVGFAPVYLIVE